MRALVCENWEYFWDHPAWLTPHFKCRSSTWTRNNMCVATVNTQTPRSSYILFLWHLTSLHTRRRKGRQSSSTVIWFKIFLVPRDLTFPRNSLVKRSLLIPFKSILHLSNHQILLILPPKRLANTPLVDMATIFSSPEFLSTHQTILPTNFTISLTTSMHKCVLHMDDINSLLQTFL